MSLFTKLRLFIWVKVFNSVCKVCFALWMITRTESNDWIVLQAKDHGYGVQAERWIRKFEQLL